MQEGETIPADANLICDYSSPEDYGRFKELRDADKLAEESGSGNQDSDEGEDEADGGDGPSEKGNGGDNGKGVDDKNSRNSTEDEDQEPDRIGQPLISCDQSAITGESLAVEKYMGDLVYYTTGCKRGKAYAVVKTTAKYSFVGRTADLVQGSKARGHFEAVMTSIGTSLLVLVMFWILVAWIGGFFHHLPIAVPGDQNLLHYALVLLIIGVPVGLPVVTTTTLAVGAAFLAKQKAIVQKLTAIESLAVGYCCFSHTIVIVTFYYLFFAPFLPLALDGFG